MSNGGLEERSKASVDFPALSRSVLQEFAFGGNFDAHMDFHDHNDNTLLRSNRQDFVGEVEEELNFVGDRFADGRHGRKNKIVKVGTTLPTTLPTTPPTTTLPDQVTVST